MKVGDLIKLPQNEGVAIAIKVVDSKPYMARHPSQVIMVVNNGIDDWWAADACEVINESR